MCARLTSIDDAGSSVQRPGYEPEEHGIGIVHIGVGAFHRAHQAVFTDDALAQHGGDWRIAGVSLRSKEIATELNAQNGLYTLIEKGHVNGKADTTARIIAAIDHVIAAESEATLSMLCDPGVRVVTLTVTEAGYGIDRESRLPDKSNPTVMADLADPANAVGVLGLLVESLYRRRESGIEPYTILSCDNLPANGEFLRDGVVGFSRIAYNDELADWIKGAVAFPNSMVDRITPASTIETYKDAKRLTGCEDKAAVETEPFIQWIIEDTFHSGRPNWEAGGALFVDDVTQYECMKLTMLNGSHSMLAYSGYLTGNSFVRDVMQDTHLSLLVHRHLQASAELLQPLPGVDYSDYVNALADRFANPSIAHQTFQIASDGTEKLPQRIFQPAIEALNANSDIRPFAFTTAMWMRFCLQRQDDGTRYELNDPRADEIALALKNNDQDGLLLSKAIHRLPEFVPVELSTNSLWEESVADVLGFALSNGCAAAVTRETEMYCRIPKHIANDQTEPVTALGGG